LSYSRVKLQHVFSVASGSVPARAEQARLQVVIAFEPYDRKRSKPVLPAATARTLSRRLPSPRDIPLRYAPYPKLV
jgi:hypothetical protein